MALLPACHDLARSNDGDEKHNFSKIIILPNNKLPAFVAIVENVVANVVAAVVVEVNPS